ncbi:hypothetical protein CMQ_4464 [Grosmannia clavigera kw1407]|uniref:Uncharacterized protein n=1 Tax=Grosmannia clavigera (strain kw1407 / UAMH 11150) TaxID=655863 RepID=F0XU60_GROCL|nr:uncharacterized protein CMQ_4464 [Grosmannia clavigera kw1407]EFW98612.1 hypothetical protein CMQ_4464 [Grosmannia clavigera kw1407]
MDFILRALALKEAYYPSEGSRNQIGTIAKSEDPQSSLAIILELVQDWSTNSHRFVLELLHNADENTYDDADPTLTMTHTADGHFRLHCNERGFSAKDVDAVCDNNSSAKAALRTATGEKGVGFKAVFRVAHTVWVVSDPYRFKIRRSSLKPEVSLAPFPDGSNTEDGGTYMYLEIIPERKHDVRTALAHFEPANLIFLKKLKHINTTVDGVRKTLFLRSEDFVGNHVSHIRIIRNRATLLCYKQFCFHVNLSVARSSHQDETDSIIKLAFPVSEDFQEVVCRDEKAEDIHGDSEWNRQLRELISDKFVEAIELLNKEDSQLCYSWPLLLYWASSSGHFFQSIMYEILDKLRPCLVLRTDVGRLVCPEDETLVRFPAKWRFGPNRELPVPSIVARSTYLSHEYDDRCSELIGLIGVQEIEPIRFWGDLRTFTRSAEFALQDEDWHIHLADLLNNDSELCLYSKSLDIIPVEGGVAPWISSLSGRNNIFFATERDGSTSLLPQGVGLLMIPEAATRDERRKRLFETYGAKYVSEETRMIAETIKEKHASANLKRANFSQWTTKDLVSHLSFLFRNRTRVSIPKDVWVATNETPQLASETFARPLEMGGYRLSVSALHSSYKTEFPDKEGDDFLDWMEKVFNMPKSARLAVSDGICLSLSPEMAYVAQKCNSSEFLNLLRQHWGKYSDVLTPDKPGFQKKLWDEIVNTKIRCQDSQYRPLKETLLPSTGLYNLTDVVVFPFLPIQISSRHDWDFLPILGVKSRAAVGDWLRCLSSLKDTSSTDDVRMHKRIGSVYTELLFYCQRTEDRSKAQDDVKYATAFPLFKHVQSLNDLPTDFLNRARFQAEELIFLPASFGRTATWVRADQCIWYGTRDFRPRYVFQLADYYHTSYYRFFVQVLGIDEHWNLSRLRYEAEHLAGVDMASFATEDSLSYIASLLAEMDIRIRDLDKQGLDKDEYLEPLKRIPMLPIRPANSTRCFTKLATAAGVDEWFIADRDILHNAFLTSVPLLAPALRHTVNLDALLSALGLEKRRLSRTSLTISRTDPKETGKKEKESKKDKEGNKKDSKESTKYTAWWRERAVYIDR